MKTILRIAIFTALMPLMTTHSSYAKKITVKSVSASEMLMPEKDYSENNADYSREKIQKMHNIKYPTHEDSFVMQKDSAALSLIIRNHRNQTVHRSDMEMFKKSMQNIQDERVIRNQYNLVAKRVLVKTMKEY